jgi:hypothetical protein
MPELFKTSHDGNGYVFHADQGHGWLAAPLNEFTALGLTSKSFSRYSYRKGSMAYLEEDCDAGIFARAYVAKYGQPLPIIEKHTNSDSPIRNYPRLRA